MWIKLCVNFYLAVIVGTEELLKHESMTPDPISESPDTLYRSRCTRRFTPGVCEDSVSPVWTFVFLLQNCTERLGCPLSHRTNRFGSYKQCMRRCRPLADVYLQILAIENYTDIFYLRQHIIKNSRREGEAITKLNITLPDIEEDREDKESVETSSREPLFNLYYRDESDVEISGPPDIDYEVGHRQEEVPLEILYEN